MSWRSGRGGLGLAVLLGVGLGSVAWAQSAERAQGAEKRVVTFSVQRQRGVDARVDYAALTRFGPWDDRNYQLRQEDLAVLPANESENTEPLPAFFRVAL